MQQLPPNQQYYFEEEELSLKDILVKAKEYWREVKINLVWISLLVGVLAGAFYFNAKVKPTTYTAGLTFMLGQTGLSGQKETSELSIFLNSINRRGRDAKAGANKIIRLARSGRIVHKALFDRTKFNGKEDYLANHLIDFYDLNNIWANEPIREGYEHLSLKNFYFSNEDIGSFSPKEYRALATLREVVSGNDLTATKGIMTISYDDLGELYKLEVVTGNENMSLKLVEAIYLELKDFYIEETVGRPRRNLKKLEILTDSLYNKLSKAENNLSQANVRKRSVISATPGKLTNRLNKKVQELSGLYTQASEQKQKLEFALNNQTPTFQIIDQTFIPIKDEPSKMKATVLGGILGLFLGLGFFILRKIIRDALAE